MTNLYKQTIIPTLSLFTSIGTLLCCALPALLVTLGMGATLAGFISTAPWITTISNYKGTIFIAAGIMLLCSAAMQWRARYAPCPADPKQSRACTRLRKISWFILGTATVIYIIGFFFAFLAADILY
tara:strand:- start:204 stop:584 length:381 start_codon:yes stop_codon:yes gene_type:complete